jgi:hypothetical protein
MKPITFHPSKREGELGIDEFLEKPRTAIQLFRYHHLQKQAVCFYQKNLSMVLVHPAYDKIHD